MTHVKQICVIEVAFGEGREIERSRMVTSIVAWCSGSAFADIGCDQAISVQASPPCWRRLLENVQQIARPLIGIKVRRLDRAYGSCMCEPRTNETREGPLGAPGVNVPSWEHFAHDADIGIRGWGATPAEAFAQAALAMTAVVTDLKSIEQTDMVAVECKASSLDLLFYRWLNAIVFEMATRGLLFGAYEVSIEESRLTGVARGEKVDRARHAPAVEVKGATLTELTVVERYPGCWLAQCVVDV